MEKDSRTLKIIRMSERILQPSSKVILPSTRTLCFTIMSMAPHMVNRTTRCLSSLQIKHRDIRVKERASRALQCSLRTLPVPSATIRSPSCRGAILLRWLRVVTILCNSMTTKCPTRKTRIWRRAKIGGTSGWCPAPQQQSGMTHKCSMTRSNFRTSRTSSVVLK